MNGWLIAAIVVAALLLFLCLLLLIPVSVRISYEQAGGLRLRVYALFIRVFRLRLNEEGKPKKKEKPKKKKTATPKEKKPFLDTLSETLTLVKNLLDSLLWLLERATLSRFRVTVVCAGEDAAATAQQYGAVCALVYPFAAWLQSAMKVNTRRTDLRLGCAFDRTEPEMALDVQLTLSVALGLLALLHFADLQSKEDNT